MIKINVKTIGSLSDILDKTEYLAKEDITVLQLIHIINNDLNGNGFLNAVLDTTEKLLPSTNIFINNANINTLADLNTKLKNNDNLFILRADQVGG